MPTNDAVCHCSAQLRPDEWASHQRRYHASLPGYACGDCAFASSGLGNALGHVFLDGHGLQALRIPSMESRLFPGYTVIEQSVAVESEWNQGDKLGYEAARNESKCSESFPEGQFSEPSSEAIASQASSASPPEDGLEDRGANAEERQAVGSADQSQPLPAPYGEVAAAWPSDIVESPLSPMPDEERCSSSELNMETVTELESSIGHSSEPPEKKISGVNVKTESLKAASFTARGKVRLQCVKCKKVLKFAPKDHPTKAVIHAQICQGIQAFACSSCGYSTSRQSHVKNHFIGSSIKVAKDSGTATKKAMQNCFPDVPYQIDDEKKRIKLECSKCGSVQACLQGDRNQRAVSHTMSCLKIRPYACTKCNYTSSVKRTVWNHIHSKYSSCQRGDVFIVEKTRNEEALQNGIKVCFPHLRIPSSNINMSFK